MASQRRKYDAPQGVDTPGRLGGKKSDSAEGVDTPGCPRGECLVLLKEWTLHGVSEEKSWSSACSRHSMVSMEEKAVTPQGVTLRGVLREKFRSAARIRHAMVA